MPEGAFCVVFQVTIFLPPCVRTVALLAAAPFRNPHGVVQISSCCAHALACAAVMFCWNCPCTATGPVTGAAQVTAVARDVDEAKSIARTKSFKLVRGHSPLALF